MAAVVLSAALGSSALAAGENDNLEGIKICIDNSSFTAGIGGLDSTSGKLAQTLYDYFVDQAAAKKIAIDELGDKACPDYNVSLDFEGTTGTPRAWFGGLNVYDSTSYFSPKAGDTYKQPVSVWSSAYYGVLTNSDGLYDYLLGQGKTIIDEFFKAYLSVN
ncbi:hypothetical protein [Deinococcus irradiatisoli]|nr:hypothetical protein [Deinococcus irradiatisoli]